ncbi:MAG: 3-oxoacyl-ACP synthase [Thermodesulfobium narugense]|nr:MAG: 3-oxoacyl-ACP synthase [Thermodesulfobium narugense]
MKVKDVGIYGWGSCVPEGVVTNFELEGMVLTSNEWIKERTGILKRHVACRGEKTSNLAITALQNAMKLGDVNPDEIDLIIVATSSPDMLFPATACIVQDAIGAKRAAAFDLSLACTGFVYALCVGSQFIQNDSYKCVAVVGADILTRFIDWSDRKTAILFGDGAGACILKSKPGNEWWFFLGSDGSGADHLKISGSGSSNHDRFETFQKRLPTIQMNGQEVFKFAVRSMVQSVKNVIEESKLSFDDISKIVPHQANKRIIESVRKHLKLESEKFYVNVERFGNTSAASIPIAIDEAYRSGVIKAGDKIVLAAFGAGFAFGSGLISL